MLERMQYLENGWR